MSKRSRVLSIVVAVVMLVAVLSVNVFAYAGVRLPVEKNIPSATAVIRRTGGVTQTPNGFAGDPYVSQYLYSGGNADNSVKLVVYSDDSYIDTSFYTGVKSLHYVFTSRSAFDFNIDFGNVPMQLFDEYLPDGYENIAVPTLMATSVKCGLAEGLNSQGLPTTLRTIDNISTEIFLNTYSIAGSQYYIPVNYQAQSYEHIDIAGETAYGVINSIAGTVNFDVGNNYNFVDVRICIRTSEEEQPFFVPGMTSCDLLNTRYIADYTRFASDHGYEIGYRDGNGEGYLTGYDEGLEYGYDVGYDTGYGAGVTYGAENAIDEMGFFSVFTKSIDALMDFPLFDLPNGDHISLGLLLGVIVGAMAFVWLLKLIAGG